MVERANSRLMRRLQSMMNERHDLYVLAHEVRHELNRQDGPVRIGLQEQIARLSQAINAVREIPEMDRVLHDTLIECIQFANRQRATNRRRVKELTNVLTTHKAAIKHLSRSISKLGSELGVDV